MCGCCDILRVYPLQVFKEGNHKKITKHRIIYFVYEVQEEVHNTFSFIKKYFLSQSLRKSQVIHEFVEYVHIALVFPNNDEYYQLHPEGVEEGFTYKSF